jgi:hypothetical protein
VFVLTHHERPPLEMEGGTVFHFVTDGADIDLLALGYTCTRSVASTKATHYIIAKS